MRRLAIEGAPWVLFGAVGAILFAWTGDGAAIAAAVVAVLAYAARRLFD